MKYKWTLILAAALLIFGLPNISQPNASLDDLKAVSEIFAKDQESTLVAENGAVLHCSMQTKKSAVRSLSGDAVAVSVNANWICR